MAANPSRIEKTDAGSVDTTYFDIQVFLDPFTGQRVGVRAYSFPVEFSALMPISWDLEARQGRIDPAVYFGFDKLPPPENSLSFLQSVGNTKRSEVYGHVHRAITNARDAGWSIKSDKIKSLGDSSLEIHPLKLYLYAQAYSSQAVEDAEAADRFNLTLDKIALLAILRLIFHASILPAALETEGQFESAGVLNRAVASRILEREGSRTLLNLTAPQLLDPDIPKLVFPASDWPKLISSTRDPNIDGVIHLPLDYLDDRLKDSLKLTFVKLKESLKQEQLDRLKALGLQHGGGSNVEYDILFEAADRIRRSWEPSGPGKDINFYKLKYREDLKLTPVVEEVDMRPMLWMREAHSLSVERALALKRQDLALEKLKNLDATGDREGVAHELRTANRALFEVKRNIERLRDELAEAGYKLKDGMELGGTTFKSLEVGKEVTTIRVVRITHEKPVTWQERYAHRECFLFFCSTSYRTRTHTRIDRWVEVNHVVETNTVPISIEWRPLEEFLFGASAKIPESTYTVRDHAGVVNAEATNKTKSVVLEALRRPGQDLSQLKRGQKDVRHLRLYENGYRDQFGYSLEKILADAEDESVRAKLLLLLPIYERRIDGELDVVKIIAVHNPFAPRAALVEPRVFLVETYANSLEQVPGHWFGPLSHTVCLFPGESRRMKLVTETRFVSQQRQERRATQRSAVEQKASVRNQVRTDLSERRSDAKQTNWSANASGGMNLGFASFGGGAGGGENTQSMRETVKTELLDRIEESLRSVSESNEVQFATMAENSQTQTSSSEQVIEFQNVNQGRAVTHKFFQVLHKYKSSVRLHDLRIVVEYGEPLIPGFDMYRTQTVKLSEINRLFPELVEDDRELILDKVKERIKMRVGEAVDFSGDVPKLTPVEIESREWMVNSGAFFLETEVSENPAVEQYIEDARKAEVRKLDAAAERIAAEAQAIRDGKLVLPSSESLTIRVERDKISVAQGGSLPAEVGAAGAE